MSEDYIDKKSIFISDYYYPCNVIGCEVKEAVLQLEGNSYCMKHFLEFVMDDLNE